LLAVLEKGETGIQVIKQKLPRFTSGGIVNVDKVLDEGTPLAVVKAHTGPQYVAAIIVIFLSDLINTFNVSRPMTPEQIGDLASEMTDELWWVRLEELLAFFHCVKRGKYGKVYERIDAPTIWACWSEYIDHRMEVVETRRARGIFYEVPTEEREQEREMDARLGAMSDHINSFKRKLNGPE
jgi:hypothetical protein